MEGRRCNQTFIRAVMSLQGKIAVITGGASGLGRGFALAFVREGTSKGEAGGALEIWATPFFPFKIKFSRFITPFLHYYPSYLVSNAVLYAGAMVVIADVDDKGSLATEEACNDIRSSSAVSIHCDVTKREDLLEAITAAKAHFGKDLDIMVNNAGIAVNEGEMSNVAKWKKMVQINLVAVIEGTHLAIETMQAKEKPGGVILNISSMAGIYPQALTPVYSAVKSGVAMFTRSLKHLDQSGIRVVALAPNFVETPIIDGIRDVRISLQFRFSPAKWDSDPY